MGFPRSPIPNQISRSRQIQVQTKIDKQFSSFSTVMAGLQVGGGGEAWPLLGRRQTGVSQGEPAVVPLFRFNGGFTGLVVLGERPNPPTRHVLSDGLAAFSALVGVPGVARVTCTYGHPPA